MTCIRGVVVVLVLSVSTFATAADVAWERIELDPVFRSEGATAFDVNKDGKIDVVTGEIWYEAPAAGSKEWKKHEIRKPGEYNGASGYSQSFACFHHDLNQDGWEDLICIGFPGVPCHWYQNPQNQEGHWKQFEIWHSAANESPQFKDVTGDNKPELVMASETEGMVGYLEIPPKDKVEQKWTFTAVSEQKPGMTGTHRYYHGLGVGDVNSDGRKDIVIPHGWWEQPEKLTGAPWTYHPLNLGKPGEGNPLAAADMQVDDLDMDGDKDIMMSSAHAHGVWWFENVAEKGAEPRFEFRVIDEHYSQTHALHYEDVNSDGTPDLITGKRFWAHGPKGDPDPAGEVVMFWYELRKKQGAHPEFIPHKMEEGTGTGIGTQFAVMDVDGDKLLDIVLSNKKGTNLLLQRRK